MLTQTSGLYDRIYAFKDYRREAELLLPIIRKHRPGATRLLDVACGTGKHLEHLKSHFRAEGVDLLPRLCSIARRRNPGVRIHQGDMIRLELPHRYDVVVCLFSSIGYVRTVDMLARAIASMAGVLDPGGILIVEPWFTPTQWKKNSVHAVFVDEPGLKIARISTSRTVRGESVIDMQYLVGTTKSTRHHAETHRLGLFTTSQMKAAFTSAGLRVIHDKKGLTGRGLYIGKKQAG